MTKKKALILFLIASLVLLIVAVAMAAGPSRCLYPGTTGRAKLIAGTGPAACAMNICRVAGRKASKAKPCDADPSCITGGFSYEVWQVEEGTWGSLSACPSWTNTATWQ